MSLDYNYDHQDNISVGITSGISSGIRLTVQVQSDYIQQPVDYASQISARHYQQAFSFYFVIDSNNVKKFTERGRMVYRMLHRYGYKIDTLEYEEIWNDLIFRETAKYFVKHELENLEKISHYIIFCIKRKIIKYTNKKNKFKTKFETGFDDLINNYVKKDENSLSVEGYSSGPPNSGGRHGGKLSKLIFKFLEDKVSPIHLKVYELTYQKGMSDKEIAKYVKLPTYTLTKIRQAIHRLLKNNKFDLLTEAGLTEDDMTLK